LVCQQNCFFFNRLKNPPISDQSGGYGIGLWGRVGFWVRVRVRVRVTIRIMVRLRFRVRVGGGVVEGKG
jgi:hypothetical protein